MAKVAPGEGAGSVTVDVVELSVETVLEELDEVEMAVDVLVLLPPVVVKVVVSFVVWDVDAAVVELVVVLSGPEVVELL